MKFVQKSYKAISSVLIILLLTVVTACSSPQVDATRELPRSAETSVYPALERGSTVEGQKYGDWVLQTAKGLVDDAYIRDNNKLGVVISSRVKPSEVRNLARSLAQGFHNSFPGQDLTVLVYAPDKELILTANYDQQSNQITYKSA